MARRNTLITFLRAPRVDSGLRSEAGAFTPLHQTWAEKTDVSDAERIAAAQVTAELSARFVVKWTQANRGVTAADMIQIGTGAGARYFAITGVKEIGFRDQLEFSTQERAEP